MKHLFALLLFMSVVSNQTVYDYSLKRLDSDESLTLREFKGKKILVVNVASKCGYTPQYEELQALYEKYQDRLVVVGIPCNQFMGQEPGTEKEIATFCSRNYGVTFPMTEKVDVKGDNQHPLYQWLTQKKLNGVGDYSVGWNFNKFLIDEEGHLIKHFSSSVKPLSTEITSLL